MADARAKALPLLGGLDPEEFHDWAEILGRWGLLRYDTALGEMLMLAAWIVLIWSMWRCYVAMRGDARNVPADDPAQINKEDANVDTFRQLRGASESNMAHIEKKTTPLGHPKSEEEN